MKDSLYDYGNVLYKKFRQKGKLVQTLIKLVPNPEKLTLQNSFDEKDLGETTHETEKLSIGALANAKIKAAAVKKPAKKKINNPDEEDLLSRNIGRWKSSKPKPSSAKRSASARLKILLECRVNMYDRVKT